MTFWRRVRTYLIGFGLGLVMVYVMFGDRELNTWVPSKRVLTAIDSSSVTISERAKCQITCLNLQENEWKKLQADATVNFSESNVNKEPCPVYHLESVYKNEEHLLIWEVCEDAEKVQLLAVRKEGKKCNC